MRDRFRFVGALALIGTVLSAAPVHAQEPAKAMEADEAALMAAYMAAATPGAEHGRLASMTGKYTVTLKHWANPSAEPQLSTASVERKMILGGRYMVEKYDGQMMDQPFEGMGMTAYDNVEQQYVSTWMDTMGTGIIRMTGNFDADGKVLTMWGEYVDPYTKKSTKMKSITTFESGTEEVSEMYMIGDDGNEWKMMEFTYTKM